MNQPQSNIVSHPRLALDLDAPEQGVAAHGQSVRRSGSREALRAEVSRLIDELDVKSDGRASPSHLVDPSQAPWQTAREARGGMAPLARDLAKLRTRLGQDSIALEIIDRIEVGVLSLGETVNALLAFTSGRKPRLEWVNVGQVVDEVCNTLASQVHARRVEITADVPRYLGVLADREMIRSAIWNLAVNALEAMPRGGRLVITSYRGSAGLELEVADSGPGLSDDVLGHVFEPFFTTKSDGVGLGLAVVHRIAELHGGRVLAANCPEGGAAFTLQFPNAARKAA
jgi:signal transduction histidine kinase